ncbi:AcrR family transcriptional regulator [Pseudonocardia eucalypti]|nr:AcrR family transcriptional regulator [Pseudonocardia eucalypti]
MSRTPTPEDAVCAALTLFRRIGYRATTMEAIAAAAGVTSDVLRELYRSKEEILRDLAEECGADVVRHAGRLGTVEADRAGLDELRVWIAGLSSVVHRRSTAMRMWLMVDEAERELRQSVLRTLSSFAETLRPRFEKLDTGSVDPGVLAIAVLTLVAWAQLTRAAQMPGIDESVVDDHLAVLVGNTLLPDLPRPTWQPPPTPAPHDEITPRRRSRQGLPALPEPSTGLVGLRRAARTSRAEYVVDRTLTAAVDVIRRQGYGATSVGEIITVAGLPRASFSAFWPDRRALLQTLTHRAALALRGPLAQLPTADTGRQDLRAWISSWLDMLVQHGPVLHLWVHESGNEIELGGLTVHLRQTALSIVDGLLPGGLPDESTERRVARVVMWALLVELPYALCIQAELLPRSDVLDVLALFLERAVPDRP